MHLLTRFSLESWYFELIHEGAPFSLCLSRLGLLGRRSAAFTVRGRDVNRRVEVGGADLGVEEDGKRVRFGAGSLTEGEDGCQASWHHGGLDLDLSFRSDDAPWLPGNNGVLFERHGLFGQEIVRWILPLPVARVTGTLNGKAVDTVGYHDFLETNVSPRAFPFEAIHKGRFYADPESIVTFLDLRFRPDLHRPPEAYGVYAHLGREPIESERTLLVRDEMQGDLVSIGTTIVSFHGRELEFLFRNTETLYALDVPDVLPLGKGVVKAAFCKLCEPVRAAQFVSATPSGERIIHGVHELIYRDGARSGGAPK